MSDTADSDQVMSSDRPAAEPSGAGAGDPAFAADSESGPAPQPEPEPTPQPEPKSESLTDAIANLLQMVVNYLRQETASLMRDKVVLPGQRLGGMLAFALAASFLFAVGLAFVSVALLLLLAKYLTWPGALGLIGGLLLVGAAVFTYLKVRSIQQ
jgi:hypothetical protein